jgi:hypothetical protein
MNTVRFISEVCLLPSDKDEDACRQRQYACNYSRDGESEDCREADHDQINGEQEHSDVFGEGEVHYVSILIAAESDNLKILFKAS